MTEVVTEENTPHVCKCVLTLPKGNKEVLVVSGYFKGKEREENFLCQEIGDQTDVEISPSLYTLDNNKMLWAGRLRDRAFKSYNQAEQGSTFRYRNAKMVKMTAEQIKQRVENKNFIVSFKLLGLPF